MSTWRAVICAGAGEWAVSVAEGAGAAVEVGAGVAIGEESVPAVDDAGLGTAAGGAPLVVDVEDAVEGGEGGAPAHAHANPHVTNRNANARIVTLVTCR